MHGILAVGFLVMPVKGYVVNRLRVLALEADGSGARPGIWERLLITAPKGYSGDGLT